MSFLQQSGNTLLQRLRLHVGFAVMIDAKDFSSEAGTLEKVGRQFAKVNGQYFLPGTLDQIVLLGFTTEQHGIAVTIRSTIRGTFPASLIRTGIDYIELLLGGRLVLIPLNKIISIEKA